MEVIPNIFEMLKEFQLFGKDLVLRVDINKSNHLITSNNNDQS